MKLTCSTHGVFAFWVPSAMVDAESATHVQTEHAEGPAPTITAEYEPENPPEWPEKPLVPLAPPAKLPSEAADEEPLPESP